MTDGLEEVVERIIPELALSGEKGASIAEFLALIKECSNGGVSAVTNVSPAEVAQDAPLSDADMSFARVAWTWLTARSEVLVGGKKQWNRLTLDEVLALPEPQPTEGELATADLEDSQPPPKSTPLPARGMPPRGTPRKKAKESRAAPETRPRIHVTEEAVWKRLTRHGVDYKRVPNSEWQCLLGIASSKREGILQVDLRNLVNQDKRSVPKRTDFLAAKGYIVKRSLFAKGTKTSKLWLADLAPAMYPSPDGVIIAKGADMSKAALTRDASAVFWHKKWTGKDIDVEAFAESLIVIVKAWGVMRYSDLRSKMGVEELQWQMRTMSRLCRNLVDMGILRYAAATFLNSRKIWKDCIKFVRDPSEEEWAKVLATGKKTSKRHSTNKDQKPTTSATPTKGKLPRSLKLTEENGDQEPGVAATDRPLPSGWVPEKPIIHTIFDAVKRAGPRGASTPQISSATIGYNFRRYVGSSLSNTRNNRQPAHLRKFEIGSELIRHGKTSTYMYSATYATGTPGQADATQVETTTPIEKEEDLVNPSTSSSVYGFSTTRPRTLTKENGSSLSALSKAAKKGYKVTPRQRRLFIPEPMRAEVENLPEAENPPSSAADEERSPKRRRIETEGPPELGSRSDGVTSALQKDERRKIPEKMPGMPPGVYIGEPGSLSPPRRKQGRPRKSLVVIFKSEKLKSPQFFESWPPPSSSFIPANQNRDVAVEVEYNDNRGQLSLQDDGRELIFRWKPERIDNEPITIHLNNFLEDPSVPLVAGGEDSCLVCVTKAADGEESPRAHTFIFKDDPNGREHAVSLQGRIIGIRTKTKAGAQADSEAPQSPVRQVDESPKPKGRRGRPGPKNGGGSGGKPFKCEKCGGAWKNDLGLKYHLTKAQTPCNPNFASYPAAEERKKRRRMPVSMEEEQLGDERGKKRGHRLRATRKRKMFRNSHRLVRGATPTFRGLAVDDSQTREIHQEQVVPREVPRQQSESSLPSVSPRKAGAVAVPDEAVSPQVSGPQVSAHQIPTKASSIPGNLVQPSEKMKIDSPVMGGTNNVETPGGDIGAELPALGSQPESLGASRAVPSRQAPRNERNAKPTQPLPEPVASVEPQTSHDHQSTSSPPPIEKVMPVKPFKSTADYRGIFSESKMKTAQAMEIMEYLLENNGGVFPGDKALFYAVIRVFLKAFSGQSPPTFNNCKVAVRNLDNKKRAREIFNAFRDTDGKLVVISMLVKTGLDPSGIVPIMLKRKIQDAHPNVFIPAAFSPSKEELRMLQELDKEPPDTERDSKNGPVFRTRRDQLAEPGEDLEVLDAPYYSRSIESNGAEGLAGWAEHQGRKQLARQTLKRQREPDAIELIERSPAKKARTTSGSTMGRPMVATEDRTVSAIAHSSEALNEPAEHRWESHMAKSPPTGNNWRYMAKEFQDRELGEFSGAPYMSHFDPLNTEPTSVAAAIRLFDLLPPKRRGPRKNHEGKITKKFGRRKNPGLDSLPTYFFTNNGRGITTKQSRTHIVRFLEPNMGLETQDGFASEDEEFAQSPDTNSTTPSERPMLADHLNPRGEKFFFVPIIVLKEKTPGVWTSFGPRYFSDESGHASFAMEGRFPDRLFLLSQNMPVDVEDMISRSKGRFGRRAAWTDTLLGKFCITADRIMNWELSQEGTTLLSGDVTMPDYVYINLTATEARASMAPVTPVWSANNMFDLNTLPYDELDDGMPEQDEIRTQQSRGRPRKDPISAQNTFTFRKNTYQDGRGKPGRKTLRVVPLGKSRQHTAYPRSADEYIAADESDQGKEDWYSESTRLAAFICVTTLIGGVSQSVDWGLLMRLFPNMTLSSLRRFWGDARKDRRSSLLTLTEKFRRGFLRAYENNELPPIDFDNVVAYDWKSLTIWTRKLLVTAAGAISLPASSKELDEQDLAIVDPTFKSRDWRETYYLPVRSYFDRFQDASSQAISIPVYKGQETTTPSVVVAMSWIRALYVTPPGRYTTQAVQHRLNLLCGLPPAERTKLIEEASYKLRDQIMIARASRVTPEGRPWKLNGRVLKVLDKAAQGSKYAEAVEFKKQLDMCFRQGKKAVVKYVCNDGMIMAILNLHAHQRINIETTGQPNVPLGYEPFNYETRKYPKKYYHFKMHISPTASYLYDDDDELAELRGRVTAAQPPSEGPHGEIPLWCDIFGQVDKSRWLQCLGAVFFMLSSRGAAGAEALTVALKPSLMTFETQLILDWACELGLLRARVEGTAPAPTEWWWMVIEAQRAAEVQNRWGGGIIEGEPGLSSASGPTPTIGNPEVESVPRASALAASGSADGDAMDVG